MARFGRVIDDFLQIADELARRGRSRPKRASLRRSVATSYYAVFHALAHLCAAQLVGRKPWTLVTPIYRSLEHQKTRTIFNANRKRWQSSPEMSRILGGFISLQDARHTADYNPEPFPFDRKEILELLDTARKTV